MCTKQVDPCVRRALMWILGFETLLLRIDQSTLSTEPSPWPILLYCACMVWVYMRVCMRVRDTHMLGHVHDNQRTALWRFLLPRLRAFQGWK